MLKQNNIYIIQIILNRSRKNYNYNRYVKLQCVQVSLLINAKKNKCLKHQCQITSPNILLIETTTYYITGPTANSNQSHSVTLNR